MIYLDHHAAAPTPGAVRRAMEEAVDDTSAQSTPSGGLLSMVSMLSKPETQKALQFLLAFACKMQARSTAQHVIAEN